jgi:hypothetical protein
MILAVCRWSYEQQIDYSNPGSRAQTHSGAILKTKNHNSNIDLGESLNYSYYLINLIVMRKVL